MRNLLHANFSRLRKDKVFWLCTAAMLVFSAGLMVSWCLEAIERSGAGMLDLFYFRCAPVQGFSGAVFSCLFLSVEYSDGTIRNKLAVGHTRREVYWSSFLTVFAASLCMALAWLVGGLAGVPLVGFLTMGPAMAICCVAVVVGFTAAFSAIYVFIGMLNDRRTVTVIMISVWLTLTLVSNFFANALWEPEFLNPIMMFQDGVQMVGDLDPNPNYISGIQREIYEFMVDFLPTGQTGSLQEIRLDHIQLDHPVRMLLSSVFITAAVTLGGMRLFQRKDLK